MKVLKALSACCLLLSSMACSNDDFTADTSTAFQVVSSIAPVSRAPQFNSDGSGNFVKGDVNTLFFHNGEQQLLSAFDYTYGSFYYWADVQLPHGVTDCLVSACYPQVVTKTPEHFEWNVLEAQPTADILVAAPTRVTAYASPTIRLSFSHLLHQLAVELQPGDESVSADVLSQAVVECRGFQPVAVLNLLEGRTLSATGHTATLTRQGDATRFMIPAQPAGVIEVVVKLEGRSATFKLAESQLNGMNLQQLESGKTLTLKIKVNKNSFTIVGQNISGWGSQGEFDDSIMI